MKETDNFVVRRENSIQLMTQLIKWEWIQFKSRRRYKRERERQRNKMKNILNHINTYIFCFKVQLTWPFQVVTCKRETRCNIQREREREERIIVDKSASSWGSKLNNKHTNPHKVNEQWNLSRDWLNSWKQLSSVFVHVKHEKSTWPQMLIVMMVIFFLSL